MASVKGKIAGEDKKDIEFDINLLNLKDRGRLNLVYHQGELSSPMDWGKFADVCIMATSYSEEELNEFTDVEIILMAKECYLANNKKKLKK